VSKNTSKCYKCRKLKQSELNIATSATGKWLLVVEKRLHTLVVGGVPGYRLGYPRSIPLMKLVAVTHCLMCVDCKAVGDESYTKNCGKMQTIRVDFCECFQFRGISSP